MITAKLVKELRDKTGAGMLDCKKALEENQGDVDKAIDYLREKGILTAQKKSTRIASEGLVTGKVEDGVAVILEVNSETDFVAKNADFQKFAEDLVDHILVNNPADLDALKGETLEGSKETIGDQLTNLIAKIGENLSIRRFERVTSDNFLELYLHGTRIAALVEMVTDERQVARDIAMQVAAISPKYVSRDQVDPEELEHEREVLRQQALNEGKPEKIVEKMVEGRLNKFFAEECLLDQAFIKDSESTVGQYLKGKGEVLQFIRYELGEGLEKREENFAEEVAKQMGK